MMDLFCVFSQLFQNLLQTKNLSKCKLTAGNTNIILERGTLIKLTSKQNELKLNVIHVFKEGIRSSSGLLGVLSTTLLSLLLFQHGAMIPSSDWLPVIPRSHCPALAVSSAVREPALVDDDIISAGSQLIFQLSWSAAAPYEDKCEGGRVDGRRRGRVRSVCARLAPRLLVTRADWT